jgi:RNA polymerase-interacting CarD/CdnL/TRCF family regulator
MSKKELSQGALLFHAVHGVCRIEDIVHENHTGKEVRSYSLVPKTATRMKVRFVVSVDDVQASGFHSPVSLEEAREILAYLKAGVRTEVPNQEQAWTLASAMLSYLHEKWEVRDARKRQSLQRSAQGLVGELAYALKMTLKEAADSVQKSLGNSSQINPMVLAALAQASRD